MSTFDLVSSEIFKKPSFGHIGETPEVRKYNNKILENAKIEIIQELQEQKSKLEQHLILTGTQSFAEKLFLKKEVKSIRKINEGNYEVIADVSKISDVGKTKTVIGLLRKLK